MNEHEHLHSKAIDLPVPTKALVPVYTRSHIRQCTPTFRTRLLLAGFSRAPMTGRTSNHFSPIKRVKTSLLAKVSIADTSCGVQLAAVLGEIIYAAATEDPATGTTLAVKRTRPEASGLEVVTDAAATELTPQEPHLLPNVQNRNASP